MKQTARYTKEILTEAAENCSNIDEVITYLGVRSYHQLRRHLFRRFEHSGIDVSHFTRFERGPRSCPKPSRSELLTAVTAASSIAGTLRELRLSDTASVRKRFHEWVAEFDIDTSHFLGQAHQRGKPGPTPRRRAVDVLVKHDGKRRTKTALLRRALLEAAVPERCDECGTPPEWHGRPMTLEIDHVNGDWSDDRRPNLRFLCPNCHAVTRTWCRGGRRRST